MSSPRDTAYSWHGGMWSPLYAFASSGIVEDHDALLTEIAADLAWAEMYDTSSVADLIELKSFVRTKLTPRGAVLIAPWARPFDTPTNAG